MTDSDNRSSAENVRPLRLCGLCHTWNSKPCGEQCGWSPRDPVHVPDVAQSAQEPVAWRVKNDFGHWYVTQDKALADTYRDVEKKDVQPLYVVQRSSAGSGKAALEQIAIVCTDNMDENCNHRMALDFVRQVANDALEGIGSGPQAASKPCACLRPGGDPLGTCEECSPPAQAVKDADDLEDAAKAVFDVLCPGVPYTADDAFWYRKAARAALAMTRPQSGDGE